MADYKLSREEQETIILWNNDDDRCRVSTYDKSLIRKACDILAKNDSIVIEHLEDSYAVFSCPKSFVKLHSPRVLSDEQKAAMAERAKVNLGRKDKEDDGS